MHGFWSEDHKTAQPHTLLLSTAVVLNTGGAWRPTLTPIGEEWMRSFGAKCMVRHRILRVSSKIEKLKISLKFKPLAILGYYLDPFRAIWNGSANFIFYFFLFFDGNMNFKLWRWNFKIWLEIKDLTLNLQELASKSQDLGSKLKCLASRFGVKLKSGGVGFRIWAEIWSETEIGGCRFQDLGRNLEWDWNRGVSVSGFGWKFGVKLKSGGIGFRIWAEV